MQTLNTDRPRPAPAADPCEAEHLGARGSAARGQELMAPHAVQQVADTFRILGDPTRIRILDALSGGELCVCDIAGLAGISESAVSHQLRLLRGMRLVKFRRAGRLVVLRAGRSAHHRAPAPGPYRTWRSPHDDLHRVRGPRRVGLPGRGHGLPRRGHHPRAAPQAAGRAGGARGGRPRAAAQHQVRRRQAHHQPHRGSGRADRDARLARA